MTSAKFKVGPFDVKKIQVLRPLIICIDLRKELYRLKMNEGMNILDHLNKFNKLIV
jgi:hypothetical protein